MIHGVQDVRTKRSSVQYGDEWVWKAKPKTFIE